MPEVGDLRPDRERNETIRIFFTILVGLSLMLLATCSPREGKMTFTDTQDSEFKVGQVWDYRTRPTETNSTLTICKVEMAGKLGKVIQISLADVRVKSPQNKDGFATYIAHLPFSESSVKQSVIQLVKEGVALPDYREGYDLWRNSVEKGEGGVWTIPVAEAVAAMESLLNK
jgi:hypothetical protein